MKKTNKRCIKNKKEKIIANKKTIMNNFLTSISKFILALAIIFLLAFIVSAGDVIVQSGKVSVGETTPGTALHIYTTTGTYDSHQIRFERASGDAHASKWDIGATVGGMFTIDDVLSDKDYIFVIEKGAPGNSLVIDSLGNVGVGTADPTGALEIQDSGSVPHLLIKSSGALGYIRFDEGANVRGYVGFGDAGNLLQNALPDSVAVRGDSGLHLAGGANALSGITITTAGKVGIGTNDPKAMLDILGNIKIVDGTQGAGKVLTSDGNGTASWQTLASVPSIPSGMIAMFDTSCPVGWTRFAALDGRTPRGAATYGGTGGTASVTPTLNWNSRQQSENGAFGWSGEGTTKADAYSFWPYAALTMIDMQPTDNWPPYLNVVWCKKN